MSYNSRSFLFALLLFIFAGLFPPCRGAASPSLQARAAELIDNGGYILAENNRIVAAHNPDTLFSPASIWKIVTSAEALHLLGRDYCFATDFYLDSQDNLYIKGHGDPLLISEKVSEIAAILKEKGLKRVNNIYLDDTDFLLEHSASGAGASLNPYDAANCGLTVNFNTIFIVKKKDGTIASAELQTPLLPLMLDKGKNLKPGRWRITIAHSAVDSLQLAGELFQAMLKKQGIYCQGRISPNRTPRNLILFHRHYSPPLDEIIRQMLLFSNNFIANQIFLVCGAKKQGLPATWRKGRKTLNIFLLKEIGLKKESFQVEEGSGLSRKNRITPQAMLNVLNYFKNNRRLLEKKDGLLLKSGTLSNVFSYAGYLNSPKDMTSFVIILNQKANNRDRILRLIFELI